MTDLKNYDNVNCSGRCTERDEYKNADIKGVDMAFMLGLPYNEMVLVTQALNRLADFEDNECKDKQRNKWFLPKEMLPEEKSNVLLTIRYEGKQTYVVSSVFEDGVFITSIGVLFDTTDHELVAWMYAPEPYKC